MIKQFWNNYKKNPIDFLPLGLIDRNPIKLIKWMPLIFAFEKKNSIDNIDGVGIFILVFINLLWTIQSKWNKWWQSIRVEYRNDIMCNVHATSLS